MAHLHYVYADGKDGRRNDCNGSFGGNCRRNVYAYKLCSRRNGNGYGKRCYGNGNGIRRLRNGRRFDGRGYDGRQRQLYGDYHDDRLYPYVYQRILRNANHQRFERAFGSTGNGDGRSNLRLLRSRQRYRR